MSVGSRKKYVLNLDDMMPDNCNNPKGGNWYVITQIIREISNDPPRPIFLVRDDKTPNELWLIAFHTDNPKEDAKECTPGSLLCIKNGRVHLFPDGKRGFRIEDPSTILNLPCSTEHLRELNHYLRRRSDFGILRSCVVCNKPTKRGCVKCKSRYCSKECQTTDWETHKPNCRVFKTLNEWNRTNWGWTYAPEQLD